jgi:hypothetical protein
MLRYPLIPAVLDNHCAQISNETRGLPGNAAEPV